MRGCDVWTAHKEQLSGFLSSSHAPCMCRSGLVYSLSAPSVTAQAGREGCETRKLATGENNSLNSFVLIDLSKHSGRRQGNGGKRLLNVNLKVHSFPLQLLPINHSAALSPAGENIAGLLNQNQLTPGSQLLTSGKTNHKQNLCPLPPLRKPHLTSNGAALPHSTFYLNHFYPMNKQRYPPVGVHHLCCWHSFTARLPPPTPVSYPVPESPIKKGSCKLSTSAPGRLANHMSSAVLPKSAALSKHSC